MNEIFFFYGLIAGINLMQAAHYIIYRQHDKPFRLAFGILSLYSHVVMFFVCVLSLYFDITLTRCVSISMDLLRFPILILEIGCLTNQDVDQLPWSSRVRQMLLTAIPILLYLVYCIATNRQELELWDKITLLIHPTLLLGYAAWKVYRYQTMLKRMQSEDRQNARWTWCILGVMLLQFGLYVSFNHIPDPTVFYLSIVILTASHGFYIERQMPADTTRMHKQLLKQHEKMLEQQEKVLVEQEKALEGLKDVTTNLKKQSEMETTIKAFRVQHPDFENRLKNFTSNRLTQRDLYLCILIFQRKRIPEIAESLGISQQSVEVARHRLRTKLNIEKGQNMNTVILELLS